MSTGLRPSVHGAASVTDDGERLRSLFAPRGVAVVGASRDSSKLGAVMARSLRTFPGPVAGVNPRDVDPAAGRFACVADAVRTLGSPLDLAVLCVPASVSAAALTEAAAGGARAALICSGGYAEAGGPGVGYQADLLAAARASDIVLLGPNTSGFIAPAAGLTASFVPGAASVPAGPVSVVAASGGVNHAVAFMLAEAGVGVSLAVGLGNAVDVATPDVLRYLVDDPATRAVALHVESVPDGPSLIAAVRTLSQRVPVVALVVGRSDVADFARSHTGALATSWRVTRAALRQAGAVLVDDERALVDAVTALSALRLPPRPRPAVGIVTGQAGPGLLHADGMRGRGVEVPALSPATQGRLGELLPPLTYQANPVDTGRPGATFGDVLRAVADDPGIDLVSIYALSEPDSLDLSAVFARTGPIPAVVGTGGPPWQVTTLRDALRLQDVPVLTTPSALTNAVVALVADAQGQEWAARRRQASAIPTALPAAIAALLDSVRDEALDEHEAKTLLALLDIATPARRACDDRVAAQAALQELGGPVAVKLLDSTVTHKSDLGGVVLGVRDAAQLEVALDTVQDAGARRYLLEAMAPPGVDLIVGATRDPVFGPVVLVGLGGVTAEAFADVATAPAPLTADEAVDLLDELGAQTLLDGFRGGPVVDRQAVGHVLAALGDLLAAHTDIESIEVNPLRATTDGLLALDAVVTLIRR
jgi:acetate---CoA ligase (ADP-forming)